MRRIGLALVALSLAIGGFYALIVGASESGEVAVLRTYNPAGDAAQTRLWVVEDEGFLWVRTGHPNKKWFRRLLAMPEVELVRGGRTQHYRAVPVEDPQIRERVNQAFREKYGMADWIVALSGAASRRVPIRLDPVPRADNLPAVRRI
jgi:uncharacterized protein DUF2255